MEDMISKILELDRAAREDLKKANQMKIDSEKKISNTKERKRAEYIEKARINISNIEKDEKEKAHKKRSRTHSSHTSAVRYRLAHISLSRADNQQGKGYSELFFISYRL